ncbi:hypothetical protein ONQ60_26260, partial [Salmonella enterica subsp. enterica serovar Virginia]|nr:hypothetical protein [Salmonella enterica subsp. enterica serovar Virginia]
FGSIAGFVLGAGVVVLISTIVGEENFLEWGWRIPFFIALPLGNDIAQDGIDMLTDDSLTTDVTISLFTDRRALDSDTLPDGSDDR